jgi:replicative DNA helicase
LKIKTTTIEDYVDDIAERSLISICANYPPSYLDVCKYVSFTDFGRLSNKIIFRAMSELLDEDPSNIDSELVRNKAIELGYENIDDLTSNGEYIEALFIRKVSKRNLNNVTRRVKDLAIKRALLGVVDDLSELVADNEKTSIDIVSEIERKINDAVVSVNHDDELGLLGEGFIEWANERADDPKDLVGLSSGLPRWDAAIGGGFRRASISLVAAQKKGFKSGLALNVAKHIAMRQDIPVLYLDTELSGEYQRLRLGASISKVPIDFIETGRWRSRVDYVAKIKEASDVVTNLPIYHTYIGGQPLHRSLSAMRYWLTKYVGRNEDGDFNDCLIIYDYIKLMKESEMGKLTEWQVLGFQATQLHDFVTRYNVPMLLLAQLNRENQIAAADRILWYVSNFSILGHKDQEEVEEDGPIAGNMKLRTMLTRYGPGMGFEDYLNLRVQHDRMHLEEGRLKSELSPDEQYEVSNDKGNV